MAKLCKCGCGETVKPPRRVWFSSDCRLEWLSHNYMAWARPACSARDDYICVVCGLDCRKLDAEIHRLVRSYNWNTPEYKRAFAEMALGYGEWPKDLWQADHIVPRCEGGLDDVDNLRTLCLWCHKAETRKLMKRRAEERRQARIALADQMPLFSH